MIETKRDYLNGWNASERGSTNALENADRRGVSTTWYDGYYDHATGRDKGHTLTCPKKDHGYC